MTTTWIIATCLIVLFGAVVFRGAPYVPTHRRTISNALDLLELEKGATIVDLGSGDGSVLKTAARRGWHAIGFEINPLLCAVAWLRCAPWRHMVEIRLRDFWLAEMPQEADAVFVFLAGPHMRHLARKLEKVMSRRERPLAVLSNGFAIPGFLPQKFSHGVYLYMLQPGVKANL